MSLKINRRVFIISTLGYVYYVKLDDVSLIKRFEISLSVKEANLSMYNSKNTKNSNNGSELNGKKYLGHSNINDMSPNKSNYGRQTNTKLSLFDNNNTDPINFSPKFVYYHSQSKMLLIVV